MLATRNEGSGSGLTQQLRGKPHIVSQQTSGAEEDMERAKTYPSVRRFPVGLVVIALQQKLPYSPTLLLKRR